MLNQIFSPSLSTNSLSVSIFLVLLTVSPLVLSTNAPVIGILAQEYHSPTFVKAFPNHHSYIAASYVKHVEDAGARVVPIFIGKNKEYYAELLSRINGVVLPGGSAYFNDTDGYADAGRHILYFADQINKQGEVFPVMAVCLGFELLLQVFNKDIDFRKSCRVQNKNCKLKFFPEAKKSSLFAGVPNKEMKKLSKQQLTHNNHIWCINQDDMEYYNLTASWNILALSKFQTWEFVSIVEHKSYPYVGLQFHPEKNAYEWDEKQTNPHNHDAIITARIFSDWFIDKARLSNHSFSSQASLYQSLIHQYPSSMCWPHHIGFEQVYLFE
uniref:folate gamma-glutamyl hydrolase n=1 Tax=Cacopsylla melanoneura TaxID=428564 RepID=A0A8D8U8K1_9HEMI